MLITLAPIIIVKLPVLPLVKNKPLLVERAQEIYEKLQRRYHVTYDAAGAIGRRYRRMDEVGTPFCITVDFDTLDDDTYMASATPLMDPCLAMSLSIMSWLKVNGGS